MKKYLFLTITVFCLAAIGCNTKGEPVEFAKVCDKVNDKKTVEVVGFFKNTGSAMCSNSINSATMRCPINFIESPATEIPLGTKLDLGSGKSSIENIEGKGLTIHDQNGEVIENTQKVRITGSVFNFADSAPKDAKYSLCSVTITKIEKVQ